MRGHRQIVAARRDGLRPAAVFINLVDEPRPIDNRYDEPENGIRFGFYPNVEVLRSDLRTALDLRFLVGLTVHVHGAEMDDDMGKLLDLVDEQRPRTIVACAGEEILFRDFEGWRAWKF